jgi:hypothetical protein
VIVISHPFYESANTITVAVMLNDLLIALRPVAAPGN